jgi:glycosyltransferase involved in cell wall biosynthesis
MAAYNASRFIKEAIDSVLSQDYDGFELLIMDDCSEDDTFDIIKKYKNHPKVKIYRNRKNLGVGATRNKLVRLSKGQYITPCDADDIMLPENLKTLGKFLDTHPDVGVVYADILIMEMDRKGKTLKAPHIFLDRDINETWDLINDAVNHPGSMMRKSIILKVSGYDETVYSVGDWALLLKLAEVTKFKYLKDRVYYIYRKHPKSLTRTDKRYNSDSFKIVSDAIKRRYDFEFKI